MIWLMCTQFYFYALKLVWKKFFYVGQSSLGVTERKLIIALLEESNRRKDTLKSDVPHLHTGFWRQFYKWNVAGYHWYFLETIILVK